MRRVIQCSVVLLSVYSTLAAAGGYDYPKEDLSGYNLQPGFQVQGDSDYSRNGKAFYFFGGYVFTDRFLSGSTQTLYLPGGVGAVGIVPNQVEPSTFNGLELGFGKELDRHFDAQVAYMQQLQETQNSNISSNAIAYQTKSNGLLGDIAYDFNPDDQFQVLAKLGAMFSEFDNSISVNSMGYTTVSDSTRLDPAVGIEGLWQFTKSFGLRMNCMYVADTQSSNSSGEINALVGLNYIV